VLLMETVTAQTHISPSQGQIVVVEVAAAGYNNHTQLLKKIAIGLDEHIHIHICLEMIYKNQLDYFTEFGIYDIQEYSKFQIKVIAFLPRKQDTNKAIVSSIFHMTLVKTLAADSMEYHLTGLR
ncbi:hypothetical protein ACJX0J_025395, partial [Zea mays]